MDAVGTDVDIQSGGQQPQADAALANAAPLGPASCTPEFAEADGHANIGIDAAAAASLASNSPQPSAGLAEAGAAESASTGSPSSRGSGISREVGYSEDSDAASSGGGKQQAGGGKLQRKAQRARAAAALIATKREKALERAAEAGKYWLGH